MDGKRVGMYSTFVGGGRFGVLLLLVWLGLPSLAEPAAFDRAEFRQHLTDYRRVVAEVAASAEAAPPEFQAYLAEVEGGTGTLMAAAEQSEPVTLIAQLRQLSHRRIAAKEVLLDLEVAEGDWFALLRRENEAWGAAFGGYLRDDLLARLLVRRQLFEYKYFEEDDPRPANILEAKLNGALPFTRFREVDAWYRQAGVSKWEATLRTEPLVLATDGGEPGALVALGMLYNFFPEVSAGGIDPYQVDVRHTLASRYLKRTGLKLGAGALFDDPDIEFLAGVGVQLRAWSVWGVYSAGDSRYGLAVSLSDFDWLKKYLPFFEH